MTSLLGPEWYPVCVHACTWHADALTLLVLPGMQPPQVGTLPHGNLDGVPPVNILLVGFWHCLISIQLFDMALVDDCPSYLPGASDPHHVVGLW